KRALGHADNLQPTLHPERREGQLIDIFLRIDANPLQRGLKLLQLIGQNPLFQRLCALRILHGAVIDIDNLLDVGRDHRPGLAAKRGSKAEKRGRTNSGKSKNAVLHGVLLFYASYLDEQLRIKVTPMGQLSRLDNAPWSVLTVTSAQLADGDPCREEFS